MSESNNAPTPSNSNGNAPQAGEGQPSISLIGVPLLATNGDGSNSEMPAMPDNNLVINFLSSVFGMNASAAAAAAGTAGATSSGGTPTMIPMSMPMLQGLPGMNPMVNILSRLPGAANANTSSTSPSSSASANNSTNAPPLLSIPLAPQFFASLVAQQLLRQNEMAAGATSGRKRGSSSAKRSAEAAAEVDDPNAPNGSRKARKNVRERARRRELNDRHDELASLIGAVREERVEWKMRVRDIYEAAKRLEEERIKMNPTAIANINPAAVAAARKAAEAEAHAAEQAAGGDASDMGGAGAGAGADDEKDLDADSGPASSRGKKQTAEMIMANRTAVLNGTADLLDWLQQLSKTLRLAHNAFSSAPNNVQVWNDRASSLHMLMEAGHAPILKSDDGSGKKGDPLGNLSPSLKSMDAANQRVMRKNAREQLRRLEVNNAFVHLAKALFLPRDHKKLHILVKALQTVREYCVNVRTEIEMLHALFFPHSTISSASAFDAPSSNAGWSSPGGRKGKGFAIDSAPAPPPELKVAGAKRSADPSDDDSKRSKDPEDEPSAPKKRRGRNAPASEETGGGDQEMSAAPARTSKRNKNHGADEE